MRVAANDGPVHGARPPVSRQQRRVILNHAVPRNPDEILRRELQNVRHYSEVDVELAQGVARLLGMKRLRLKDRRGRRARRPAAAGPVVHRASRVRKTRPRPYRPAPRKASRAALPKVLLANDGDAHA